MKYPPWTNSKRPKTIIAGLQFRKWIIYSKHRLSAGYFFVGKKTGKSKCFQCSSFVWILNQRMIDYFILFIQPCDLGPNGCPRWKSASMRYKWRTKSCTTSNTRKIKRGQNVVHHVLCAMFAERYLVFMGPSQANLLWRIIFTNPKREESSTPPWTIANGGDVVKVIWSLAFYLKWRCSIANRWYIQNIALSCHVSTHWPEWYSWGTNITNSLLS